MSERVWQTGDRAMIRMGSNSIAGTVKLASPNGRSLMLAFEAILNGHVGTMPVLQGADGVFRSVVTGDPVELQPLNLRAT